MPGSAPETATTGPALQRPVQSDQPGARPLGDGLTGLSPVVPRSGFGLMPNRRWQGPPFGFLTGATYELAIVEFDDQGCAYDRAQIDGAAARLDGLAAAGRDAIIIAFVHGWKHDGRSDDDDLSAFRLLLAETVAYEQSITEAGQEPRPVLGVFVAWRGLSYYSPHDGLTDFTFWGRQSAGLRVAVGSVREVFGHLKRYRDQRLAAPGGAPVLVIAGHSFGGMIVFSALAQSLIEAASTAIGTQVPNFADLVLLINPAIEGARFLPIYDLTRHIAQQGARPAQLPVFVCAQAKNDVPVGKLFPLGNLASPWLEATRGQLERRAVNHAIGFIEEFRTHELTGPADGLPFRLSPPSILTPDPFWVVAADKAVINNHSGIWQPPFLLFLASLVFQQVHGAAAAAPPPAGPAAPGGTAPALARRSSALKRDHPALAVWHRGGTLAEFACQLAAGPFTCR